MTKPRCPACQCLCHVPKEGGAFEKFCNIHCAARWAREQTERWTWNASTSKWNETPPLRRN